ncbi:MAG: hypothetical protein NVS3B10_12690 [Polyangiales bacterium]
MRKLASVAAIVGCAAALAGCGADYDHTDITNVKGSLPFEGTMDYARIVVPVGMVVTAHIVSLDDDKKTMSTGIQSKDKRILEVAGVVTPDDYAFLGLAPGTTDVEITAAGKVVLVVTAVVTNQPTLP